MDVNKIIEKLDYDELCKYCNHRIYCSGGVHGGPNGPIYPPCSDGFGEDDFDLETYLEDSGEENAN